MPITQNDLAQKISNLIQSQKPIHPGSSTQSKSQGQSVAVRLNNKVPGAPSVVRAIAFTPIQPGKDNVSLIRLSEPINGSDWGAFSNSSNQLRSSNSNVVVGHVPQPFGNKKKIDIKIGYTGKS